MSDETSMTSTQVKTKTVSKTAMALAVAFLGISAIVAAAAGITSTSSTPSGGGPLCMDTDISSSTNAGNMSLAIYKYANLQVKGTTTGIGPNGLPMVGDDKCWSGTRVLEYFCDVKNNKVTWNSYNCPTGTNCVSGACIPQVVIPTSTSNCYDSDGGLNYEKNGMVKVEFSYGFATTSDYCVEVQSGNSKLLNEKYCSNDLNIASSTYDCSGIKEGAFCDKGACIYPVSSTPASSCYDTDGGKNSFVKGQIIYDGKFNGSADSCLPNGVGVQEFFCMSDGSGWNTNIPCPDNSTCLDGACKVQLLLKVSLAPPYPSSKIFLPNQSVNLLKFSLENNSNVPINIKSIKFNPLVNDTNYSNYTDFKSMWISDSAGNYLTSVIFPSNNQPQMVFSGGELSIPANGYKSLIFKGILKDENAIVSGHSLGYTIASINDIVAESTTNGGVVQAQLSVSDNLNLNNSISYVFKSYPILTKLPVIKEIKNGIQDLIKFEVAASGGHDISLYKVVFLFNWAGNVQIGDLSLYDVTNPNNEILLNTIPGNKQNSTPGNAVWSTNGENWKINIPAGEIVISPASSHIFKLRANITGAVVGDSISTKVLSSSAFYGQASINLGSSMGTASEVNNTPIMAGYNAFIWSDVSVVPHSTESKDWTTGYLLPGLSATGSATQILNKTL